MGLRTSHNRQNNNTKNHWFHFYLNNKEFINFYSSLINIIGKLELINLLLIDIKNKVKLNNFDKTLVEIRLNTFLTLINLINLNKINFKTKQIKILLNIKEDPIC